jgi:hypothetical protein
LPSPSPKRRGGDVEYPCDSNSRDFSYNVSYLATQMARAAGEGGDVLIYVSQL